MKSRSVEPNARHDIEWLAARIARLEQRLERMDGQLKSPNGRYSVTRWERDYVAGRVYRPGDIVFHNGILAVCEVETGTAPLVIEQGNPFWVSGLGDTPSWTTDYVSDQAYETGIWIDVNQLDDPYDPLRYFYTREIRVWTPDTTNQQYSIWMDRHRGGNVTSFQLVAPFTGGPENAWRSISVANVLWQPGDQYALSLVSQSLSGPTTWQGYWQQINRNGTPSEGEVNFYNNQTRIRFHYTDKNDINQEQNLRDTPVGAEVSFGGREWTITSATFNSNDADFNVTPGGQRPGESEYTYTFSYGAIVPLDYVTISNGLSGVNGVSGFRQADLGNPNPSLNNHAYGIDVKVVHVTGTLEWAIWNIFD